MKSGFYIVKRNIINEKDLEKSGIHKKMASQFKAMSIFTKIKSDIHYSNNTENINKWLTIKRRLPFTAISTEWKYSDKYKNVDFLYIRRVLHDNAFIKFLKNIKKHNNNIKIIYEIPTYPYDKEIYSIKNLPFKFKDMWNRRKLKHYVDRIATFSNDDYIFGIKTIKMINGFDFNSNQLSNYIINNNSINLIAVSVPEFWHGYDRILKGIGQYYRESGSRKVVFHMVGDGVSTREYKKIVKDYGIEDFVIFHGNLSGADLDDVYDKCSIAIESLGNHRKEVYLSSSLKSREYYAKGLPMITSNEIDFVPNNFKYLLTFPADESPIDIQRIIEFHDSIFNDMDIDKIKLEIREFARERCEITKTMKPIIDYILDV